MRGSVRKRCSCPARRDSRGRLLACTKNHGSWIYTVDLGPGLGADGKPVVRRQVVKGGFPTRQAAEAALAAVIDQTSRGLTVAVDSQTVATFLRAWLNDKISDGLRPTTAASYTAHLERYFIPRLGHLKLRDLRPQHVETALREIAAARAAKPATLRRIHATLRSALGTAVKRRLIPYNPAVAVTLPSVSRPHVRPWEPDELGRFLDHAGPDPLGPVFHVLAATGLRRGEVLGLAWDDVDLTRSRLVVRRQVVTVTARFATPCEMCGTDHGRLAFGRPKTSSGEDRIVDLDPHTVGVLLEHRLRQDRERETWGEAYNDHDLVFAREDGTPIPPDRVSDRFAELAAEAGLRPVRLHDLRHGQASLLLAAGIDIVVVSKRLGHSSVAITSDTYSHLLEGVGREAAERAWALVPRALPPDVNQDREHSVSIRARRPPRRKPPYDKTAGQRPKGWSRLGESNPGPTHYECVALPTELRRRCATMARAPV